MSSMMNQNLTFKIFLLELILTVNCGQQQSNFDFSTGTNYHENESVQNYDNVTGMEDVLELFSVRIIGSQWKEINEKIKENSCAESMMQYLSGLKNRQMWAMKMDDASGRYTSGYFWGNNYWAGSMTLCRTIFESDNGSYFAKKLGNSSYLKQEKPPFVPRFSVLKVLLNEVFAASTPRTVYIGVCLPSSCNKNDVYTIAKLAQSKQDTKTIEIEDVRIPNSDGFSLWKDETFLIVITVSIVVGVLMAWATVFDIKLKNRIKEQKKYSKSYEISLNNVDIEISNNNNYEEKSICIKIPTDPNSVNNDNKCLENVVVKEANKLSLPEKLLLSFSLWTNFNAICNRTVQKNTIPCIHGIRVLSMAVIMLGHTLMTSFKYSDNMELRKVTEQQLFFRPVANGAFSVDTFFFISGFLFSLINFRSRAKGKVEKLSENVNKFTSSILKFTEMVLHRFFRLTAPYLYVLGTVTVTMKYFYSNSVFEPPAMDHVNCPKYWWRNILYVNNFFPAQDMCMLWSWYLANDMQFYIVGAMILLIAMRHLKFAAATLGVFIVSAWLTTGVITYTSNLSSSDDPMALFDLIYMKPWTRFGPYAVGMLVGWVLFKTNCTIKFTKVQLATGWIFSVSILLLLLYGINRTKLSESAAAAYSSLSHSAWAIAISWIVIACATGHGGFLNKFLSATCFLPLSRVTYCAYLVNTLVVRSYALSSDAPLHMGNSMVLIFLGQAGASYFLSFFISLSFEVPFCELLKVLSEHSNNKQN